MKVFMTGGTGFVGTYLTRHLIKEGHEVTILTPAINGTEMKIAGLAYVRGNPTIKGAWQENIRGHDVIIN